MTSDDVIAAVAPLWPYEELPGHLTPGEVVAKLAGLVAFEALSAETRAELCSGVLRIHWIKLSEGHLRRFQNQPERMRRKAALVDALTAVLELLSPTDNVIRVDAQLALAEHQTPLSHSSGFLTNTWRLPSACSTASHASSASRTGASLLSSSRPATSSSYLNACTSLCRAPSTPMVTITHRLSSEFGSSRSSAAAPVGQAY